MFVYNPFLHDSRVLRQARMLARSGHHVRVIATCEGDESEQDLDGFHVVRVDRKVSLALAVWRCLESLRRTLAESLPPQSASGLEDPAASVAATGQPADPSERTILPLGIGRHLMRVALPAYGSLWWLKYCRRALRAAARESVDLWVAHDLDTLPIATLARARHGGKLLYDSHELYVEVPTAARGRMWRLRWTLIEGILIRHVDRVMTVSDGVARELSRRYRVQTPAIIRNVPEIVDASGPRPRDLRAELDLSDDTRLVLHLGRIDPDRGLEHLVPVAVSLPDLAVALVGDGSADFIAHLRDLARESRIEGRFHILRPVPPAEVIPLARTADVGMAIHSNNGLSRQFALPNKLFEYLAAGVPVVTSDFPAMADLVKEHDVGATCDSSDPASIGQAIREVTHSPPRHEALRHNAATASLTLNWDVEGPKLLALIDGLTSSPSVHPYAPTTPTPHG